MKQRVVSALVTILALHGSVACTPVSRGRSAVGQGKRYTSHQRHYDRFFTELHALQIELHRAPHSELQARRDLAAQLHVSDVSPRQLAEHAERGKRDHALWAAVQHLANTEATLLVRMRRAQRELERLRGEARSLREGLDDAFSGGRRGEVLHNLNDAEKLFPIMQARAVEIEAQARAMLDALGPAPAAPEPPPRPPPDAAPEGTPPPARPAPRPPPPATEPSGGTDFEP